jgi:hypothetical protein
VNALQQHCTSTTREEETEGRRQKRQMRKCREEKREIFYSKEISGSIETYCFSSSILKALKLKQQQIKPRKNRGEKKNFNQKSNLVLKHRANKHNSKRKSG